MSLSNIDKGFTISQKRKKKSILAEQIWFETGFGALCWKMSFRGNFQLNGYNMNNSNNKLFV